MTSEEINELLKLASRNDLAAIKKYLLEKKAMQEANVNKAISFNKNAMGSRRHDTFEKQSAFEKYMSNSKKTSVCMQDENIIFTNGISIYYINKVIIMRDFQYYMTL